MKEKPILFSTPMVQAILDGRKTMTRRTVKFPVKSKTHHISIGESNNPPPITWCPYGEVGTILWVRETFYAWGSWIKNGFTKSGKQKYKFIDITLRSGHVYQYEGFTSDEIKSRKDDGIGWYKRPSLFMPREAGRLFLEITNKRVERLQDISEDDAMCEGINKVFFTKRGIATPESMEAFANKGYHKKGFTLLWNSINGPESWSANPWVWVIEFKRSNQ